MSQSLKIIRIAPGISRILIVSAALFCIAGTWFSVRWHFANAVASAFDRKLPESPLLANWLTEIAPGDPSIHLAAAVTFEKTFDFNDLDRSMREYEMATAGSPHNYLMWLSLGKVRNLNGDAAGADAALKRSLELAPSYAAIQWAYGNFLVRQGRTDEGFAMMAKAAAADTQYSRAAAATALQIFDGDVAAVRRTLGTGEAVDGALVMILADEKRFDEAVEYWSAANVARPGSGSNDLGDKLVAKLAEAKQFRYAIRVTAEMSADASRPAIETIGNGGFESAVKLRGAGLFDWRIADGGSPQIGLSEDRPHSGKYDLTVVFNSFETAAFRSVSQTVVVSPGFAYEVQGYYRSDVKTAATLRWEIADASTTGTIARTEALGTTAGWTQFSIRFTVPANADGVILRFNREGCIGASCPANGTISFDDLSIRRL